MRLVEAFEETLAAVESALRELAAIPGLWIARPDHIADWVAPERARRIAAAERGVLP